MGAKQSSLGASFHVGNPFMGPSPAPGPVNELEYPYNPLHMTVSGHVPNASQKQFHIPQYIPDPDDTPIIGPSSTNPLQPWSGFCPTCEYTPDKCAQLPCQTSNITAGAGYREIETPCDPWLTMACEYAKEAVTFGGGPFASVIVRVDTETNEVIEFWRGFNHVVLWSDPTAHGEVTTIRLACKDLSERFGVPVFDLGTIIDPTTKRTSHCKIFINAEPCPMCYAAIYWAGITTIVFAATRHDAAQQGVDFGDAKIYEDIALPYDKRRHAKVYHAKCPNSLDAFNLWKRIRTVNY